MASEGKKIAKSESLTIRLNPRTRFVLEFIARMRGQTITTVVERALEAAGDQTTIKRDFGADATWKDFWDISEGVRALKVSSEPELFPTYEEEKRLHFAKQFKEYFFQDDGFDRPKKVLVDILWPKIDEFIEHFEQTKQKEYFSVEREMRKAIRNAQVKLPKSRAGVDDPPTAKPSYELDDDIPF